MTADGSHFIASGSYPPQFRVFDVNQLSLKFERRVDAEIVQYQVIDHVYLFRLNLG